MCVLTCRVNGFSAFDNWMDPKCRPEKMESKLKISFNAVFLLKYKIMQVKNKLAKTTTLLRKHTRRKDRENKYTPERKQVGGQPKPIRDGATGK